MIEGVKLHVKSEELGKLLKDRATYHLGRAEQKTVELPKLSASMKSLDQPPRGASMVSNSQRGYGSDPVTDLEDQIRAHKLRARTLTFFAEHLAPSEVYSLTEADLTRLELVVES
jgi:hypothetical protein